MDKALEDEEHEVAETFAQDLLATAKRLSDTAPKPDGDEKHNKELQSLHKQYAEMQLNFQKLTKMLEEEMSRLREKINRTPSSPVEPPFPKAPEVVIRREFRINGQICELQQKDKLSYTNLMHQIDTEKRKGHGDAEIVEAVVKAATPGRTKRACRGCQDNGEEEQCDHCFKCGLSGYLSTGCTTQRNTRGNTDTVNVKGQTVEYTSHVTQEQLSGSADTQTITRESIHQLEERLRVERGAPGGRLAGSAYVSHISSQHHSQLLRLIGKKCMVNCYLDGVKTRALWDTGSQVCLINDMWRKKCIPKVMVRSTEELLGPGALVGKAVNQTDRSN